MVQWSFGLPVTPKPLQKLTTWIPLLNTKAVRERERETERQIERGRERERGERGRGIEREKERQREREREDRSTEALKNGPRL